MTALIRPGPHAQDATYLALLRDDFPQFARIRESVEELWKTYEPYADPEFQTEIGMDFHSRFWEMYLTCALLHHGLPVQKAHPGPDNLVVLGGQRIWIEAVAPTPGADKHPDRVPDMQFGKGFIDVPDDQILLRYSGAISEKFGNKYQRYLERGIVAADDPFVIAINGSKIDLARVDPNPPRIVRAVYPIGDTQLHFDRQTAEPLGWGVKYRDSVEKASGAEVATNLFVTEEHAGLSAVLQSGVDAANQTATMGEDFLLVHNHMAAHSLPHGFLPFGTEYIPEAVDDAVRLTRISH